MSDAVQPTPPPEPQPSRVQAESIKQRWLEGQSPDTRAALDRHPELRADKSAVLDLAYEEYCLRREAGEAIDPDDYCDRFPVYRTSLRKLLAAHHFLDANAEVLARAAPPRWPQPGEEYGDFSLIRELGRGAFARVYLATESSTGDRPVAVKFTAEGTAEARTLGRLEHPNIVPILSARQDPGGLTVVCMPYLGRTTVQDLLDRAYPLANGEPPSSADVILEAARSGGRPGDPPVPERTDDPALVQADYVDGVLHLGIQLADALAFIHGRGVCHRDLKPSNVLLDPGGRPMLLDFNLSTDDLRSQLRAGGTLPYMAPEQLRWMEGVADGSHPATRQTTVVTLTKEAAFLDPRADLFALGVLLYELLAGKHPFGPVPVVQPGTDIALWLLQRQGEGCRPLRELNPRVSATAARWIESCLEWSVAKRPASAAMLAAGLRRHFTAPARLRRWVGRNTRLVTAAGIVMALGVSVAALAAAARDPFPLREFRLGESALRAGDLDRAERHLAVALEADRNHAESWSARGRLFLARGDVVAALGCFEEARKLQPTGLTLAASAYCMSRNGDHRAALVRADAAMLAGERTAAAHNNRAFSRIQTADLEGAEQDLNEAIRQASDLVAARYNRAQLALQVYLRDSTKPLAATALGDWQVVLDRWEATSELLVDSARVYAAASKAPGDEHADRAVAAIREALALGADPEKLRRNALLRHQLRGRADYNAMLDQARNRPALTGNKRGPTAALLGLLDPYTGRGE